MYTLIYTYIESNENKNSQKKKNHRRSGSNLVFILVLFLLSMYNCTRNNTISSIFFFKYLISYVNRKLLHVSHQDELDFFLVSL